MASQPPSVAGASTNNNSRPAAAKPAAAKPPVPPDEQFWERYSPHHEAPLSGVGSFALHFLIAGFLLLAGYLGWLGLGGHNTPPPVDVVRFEGGGGGDPRGQGDGPGDGKVGHEVVEDAKPADRDQKPADTPARPELKDPVPMTQEPPQVAANTDPERFIKVGTDSAVALSNIGLDTKKMLRDGTTPAGAGKGGKGSGGGEGTGVGPGKGSGKGEGNLTRNQRERRMMRWTLRFQNRTGDEYVRQLAGLGAILGIPKDRAGTSYWVVRDLAHRPAKLLDEDVYALNRIFWNNTRPEDVSPVLQALGVNVRASHFVAFMPQELEEKLAEDELRFMGLSEDEIQETQFDVRFIRGKYVPVVVEQRRK